MYAVFGYVTSGMEIIDSVCESVVPVDDSGLLDKASQPVMSSVSIRIEDKS